VRSLVGRKNALAVEHREPLRIVPWAIMNPVSWEGDKVTQLHFVYRCNKPVCFSPFKSLFSYPISTPASTKAAANGV